jgi:hypothetical protein
MVNLLLTMSGVDRPSAAQLVDSAAGGRSNTGRMGGHLTRFPALTIRIFSVLSDCRIDGFAVGPAIFPLA